MRNLTTLASVSALAAFAANTDAGSAPAPAKSDGLTPYRAFVYDISDPVNPKIQAVYVRATKYGPAWKAARRLLDTGKPHPEAPETVTFFSDVETTKPIVIGTGDHLGVATLTDLTKKTPKIDKVALAAILNDSTKSEKERLAAATALVGA